MVLLGWRRVRNSNCERTNVPFRSDFRRVYADARHHENEDERHVVYCDAVAVQLEDVVLLVYQLREVHAERPRYLTLRAWLHLSV